MSSHDFVGDEFRRPDGFAPEGHRSPPATKPDADPQGGRNSDIDPPPGGQNQAPITGQGDEFFHKLSEWEMSQLRKLPADYFGETQSCTAVAIEPDMDTEPYPPDYDTRRILPTIVDCEEWE